MLMILLLLLLLLQLFGVVDGWSRVVGAMSKRTMGTIFRAVAFGVRFMDANGSLVVSQVISLFSVARIAMHVRTVVVVGTHARLFVIFLAVDVRIVVERAVASSNRSTTSLILKVPVEARVGSMLSAFVLQEERTLIDAKAIQLSVVRGLFGVCVCAATI